MEKERVEKKEKEEKMKKQEKKNQLDTKVVFLGPTKKNPTRTKKKGERN